MYIFDLLVESAIVLFNFLLMYRVPAVRPFFNAGVKLGGKSGILEVEYFGN